MPQKQIWERVEHLELKSDTRTVEVTVDTSSSEVLATVRSLSPGPDRRAWVQVELEEPRFSSSPTLPSSWPMTAGLPPVRWGANDPFVALTRHAGDLLFPHLRHDEAPKRSCEEHRARKKAGKETLSRAYAVLRRAAIEAARRAHPIHRKAVMRFAPRLRWQLYTWLQHDPSRRWLQLMHSCPGLASTLVVFEDHWALDSFARRAYKGVQAGASAKQLTRKLVDAWHHALDDIGDVGPYDGLLFELAALQSPTEARRTRLRKQLLIKRAGPRVDPITYLLPPPLAFVAHDIPRRVYANARWYAMMHASPLMLGRVAPERVASARGVAAFLSKNAQTIGLGIKATEARTKVGALARYCVHVGRVPNRKTSLPRVLRAFERSENERRRYEDDLPEGWDATNPGHRLPEPFVPGYEAPGIAVMPIDTTGALEREAKLMHHCIRTRLGSVMAGVSSLYSAKVGGERATIELRREPGRALRVFHVAGVCNEPVSSGTRARLEDWLKAGGGRPEEEGGCEGATRGDVPF